MHKRKAVKNIEIKQNILWKKANKKYFCWMTSSAVPTVRWILACQNPDAGFGLFPGDASNLLATACAVQSLHLLHHLLPERRKIMEFLKSKCNENGGFRNRFGRWPDESALCNTYYALSALAGCGGDLREFASTADFIHSRQREDGGFVFDYWMPENDPERSSLLATYYAVKGLFLLGQMPRQRNALSQYLLERQSDTDRQDGSFNWKKEAHDGDTPRNVGLLLYTGMGLSILPLLNLAPWNADKSADYILNLQEKNGGFSKGLGVYKAYDDQHVTRMTEAYYAALGLTALDLPVQNPTGLQTFIESCLQPDGGFARLASDTPADMEATFFALATLQNIDAPFPAPAYPIEPVHQTNHIIPKALCPQFTSGDQDELRYLARIGKPLYNKHIRQGEWAVITALREWVAKACLFTSNYSHSGAQIIIDGLATCGPQGRAYTALANASGIETRMLYIKGHGLAESKINGRWTMVDPIFSDIGQDEHNELKSAWQIRQHFLKKTGKDWTHFGDFRYEEFELQKPDGTLVEIRANTTFEQLVSNGLYTIENDPA